MDYDFAINHLQNLKKVLEQSLEKWESSDWRDNEVSHQMINTYKRLIQEIDEEIAIYVKAKETGVFVTRDARNKLKEIRKSRRDDEIDI